MTNLSPTSSSDLIFNNFNNEMAMQNTNTLDDPTEYESNNEIQLAKLKRIMTDASLNTNDSSNLIKDAKETDDITNSLENSNPLSNQQFALMSNAMHGHRNGGGHGVNKRNLFDRWILIRRRRDANKSFNKGQLESRKGGGKSGGRNR